MTDPFRHDTPPPSYYEEPEERDFEEEEDAKLRRADEQMDRDQDA